MLKGFKEFISQGNALELAVAVIIGAAFKPIVDAITKVIMTIIGQLIGSPNFDSLGAFSLYDNGSYTFHLATAEELAKNPDGYVMPGTIITTVINFFLVAAAVYFAIVMPMNTIKERMAKEKAEEEAKKVTDIELLTEIRDCSPPSRRPDRSLPALAPQRPAVPGSRIGSDSASGHVHVRRIDPATDLDRFRRETGPISARNRTDLEPELNRSRRGDPALTTCDRCRRSCRHRRWRDHCAL